MNNKMILSLLHNCLDGNWSFDDSFQFFTFVSKNEVSPVILSSVLTALNLNGFDSNILLGAVEAFLNQSKPIKGLWSESVSDIVGTGGDGFHTMNISTTSAFVLAAGGVPLAKHGNKGVSSLSGSSDVLTALGVNVNLKPDFALACLSELGLNFFFAPIYHPAMKYAASVRSELKIRTIFNLLGPLLNPLRPKYMMVGVYDPALVRVMAECLLKLGVEKAFVVSSGLDEISLETDNHIAYVHDAYIEYFIYNYQDFGVPSFENSALKGGDSIENAQILEAILQGKGTEAQMYSIAVNCAPLFMFHGYGSSLKEATSYALKIIHSKQAFELLTSLKDKTNAS